jgi:SAM-dependent methyltransferase
MQLALHQLMHEVERTHWWFTARRRILVELLAACVPARPDALIVDIGCGTGGNLAALSDRYACLGIDASPDAIGLACQSHPAIPFVRGELPDRLPSELSEAAAVIATDVLEHVEQDADAMASIVERIPDRGVVLLTVPADMALWSAHDVAHGHYRRYTRESLARLWSGLPVETLLLSYFNARLYPVIRALRTIGRWRGKAWGQAGTDLSMPPALLNRFLASVFAGESRVLVETLQGQRKQGYNNGVSLVAILRKRPINSLAESPPIAAPSRETAACASAP